MDSISSMTHWHSHAHWSHVETLLLE